MSAVETTDLTVGYGRGQHRRIVLSGVNERVHPGEFIALVGPNGAGKSTLLRTLAQLQPPLAGTVHLAGRPAQEMSRGERARTVATVLTDTVETQYLRVHDLVALARHPHRRADRTLPRSDRNKVTEALSLVGASVLADQEVASLSDGQRQRVLIARALAQEPRLLLLDEPTSFLDPPGRIAVMSLLKRLARDRHLAILVCTHDVDVALEYCDQLWVAAKGVVHSGKPRTLAHAGAIDAAFADADVEFDVEQMRFRERAAHR